MESVLQRLGFLVDTSGLMRGQAAMDSAAAAGVRLGAAADLASLRLSSMGRGPASANLQNVSREMNNAANATREFNQNAEMVSSRMTMLGTAAGTVAGILAFQLVASIASVVSELASIPIESARAQDALTRFSAQLTFAFRGSAESVRQANADIIVLAREAGVSLSQLRNDYADIAISGRAAGLTRSGVSDVVGAFANLGQLSGADPGALSRSMYQYQQMLNLGTVRWADYRLADLNLPAFGDAVAAGESAMQGREISSSELIGMISRGEMSAMRLTEALAQGVPRLLEEAGGELPQVMSRSQAAMETQWTLLMEEMGTAFRTSEFMQSLQYGIADLISGARGLGEVPGFLAMSPEERLQAARDGLARDALSGEIARADEEAQARDARHRNAFGIVTNLDPIRAAQAQTRADIDIVQQGLADTTGLTSERVAELRRGLALLEGQLGRIESAVDRARRQARESAADLQTYGAGGGYDLARSARGLVEQSINQMRPIGMDGAMAIVRGEWLTDAANDQGQGAVELDGLRAQLAAVGLSTDARRRQRLDAQEAQFRRRFGNPDDMPDAQRQRVDELAIAARGQASERSELEDRLGVEARARGEREQLEAMRERLEMGLQLGQQGRVAIAQMEMERRLRLEVGDLLADELLPAERARVAEMVRMNEELAFQQRQFELLADAARIAGAAIGDALAAGIIQGVREGGNGAEAALTALQRSAERILGNLISRVTAPLERRIEEMVAGPINSIFANDNDPAREAIAGLADGAKQAGAALSEAMLPSVVEAAAKTAISTSATDAQIAAQAAATSSLIVFTKALDAAAAKSAGGGSADIAGAIASAFIGGFGGGHSGGQGGGGARNPVPRFATGVRGFLGGWAIVGEEGPELLNLPRGSNVFSNSESKKMLSGGGDMHVTIIDQRGAGAEPVQTKETRGPGGERMLEVFVRDAMRKNVVNGEMDTVMRQKYGSAPTMRKT